MPEVCRFYGIAIRFYYREHPPPHFHAIYGEHEALIEIETGDICSLSQLGFIRGNLSAVADSWFKRD